MNPAKLCKTKLYETHLFHRVCEGWTHFRELFTELCERDPNSMRVARATVYNSRHYETKLYGNTITL